MTKLTDRQVRSAADLGQVRFDADALVPVVAQDAKTGDVLMVAWANREALERSVVEGALHFWSRSRGALWKKGETSGSTLALVSLHTDCDGDTLLALVNPAGPACHTGELTCFGAGAAPSVHPEPVADAGPPQRSDTISALAALIHERIRERPEGSYTTRLLGDENLRLKKLGEETAELVAALSRGAPNAAEEAADLIYHVMVALEAAGPGWAEVEKALERRRR
jgi:phosphoribosyl-ATP pyrophosphohydrolase/phosphoribosyl-AMP cyclohydrolase